MAERRTRRSFTREFKAQAVKRLLDGGKGLSEVATELGIGTGQLSQWRTEHLAAGSAEALAVGKAEQAETQRLKRAVKRLEEEVAILRKAAAFTLGSTRSPPSRAVPRRKPSGASRSAASSPPAGGSMARHASTPNCAG